MLDRPPSASLSPAILQASLADKLIPDSAPESSSVHQIHPASPPTEPPIHAIEPQLSSDPKDDGNHDHPEPAQQAVTESSEGEGRVNGATSFEHSGSPETGDLPTPQQAAAHNNPQDTPPDPQSSSIEDPTPADRPSPPTAALLPSTSRPSTPSHPDNVPAAQASEPHENSAEPLDSSNLVDLEKPTGDY